MTTIDRTVRTACPYCGVGCGVLATADGSGGATIAGNPDHPANFGRLCSKGWALGETLGLGERLLHPLLRNTSGELARATWSDALAHVSNRLREIVGEHGPGSVAFYLSGQLLTEDYYVANKLMKGFLGTANVDTNSRLCMASSVAGHRRAFGADIVPGCYEDLDKADLLILVGSNAAWCHPVLYQRILANKLRSGARIVVIDPRRTETAGDADLFLGLKPGSDTALFSGLLVYLSDNGVLDKDYIAAHTSGFDAALERATEIAENIAATAEATGLDQADVSKFFSLVEESPRMVTLYSQGVNQSAQGTDKVNAIINCHLATGRIGKPGMGPFSLTGQPNAMGGREVGGLANQLAAHMNFTPGDIDRVRRFWHAPDIATREGLKAVAMFDAIARGEIKALWVMGTNPAVSMPEADKVRVAMKKLDLFVISENVRSNDSVNCGANVLLPAQAWGEKSGTVTNSERCISRQRAFLTSPGEAKPDWWIVSEVAKRLGFGQSFSYSSAADIFREHARLSEFENNGTRGFDIGALSDISSAEYDSLTPFQWPRARGDADGRKRLFTDGVYLTDDRRARLIAPDVPRLSEATTVMRGLRLNTGRIRDQWHTMTRTGTSPRLAMHLPEPFVEVHPDDARKFALRDGGFAEVVSDYGACVLKVVVSQRQQRGMLFAPIHWSAETASSARVGALMSPFTDPVSGQPESKSTPASIRPVAFAQRGFVVSRRPRSLPLGVWWSRVALTAGFGYLFAADIESETWRAWLVQHAGEGDVVDYQDAAQGIYRAALLAQDTPEICVFTTSGEDLPQWDAVQLAFASQSLTDDMRRMLMSGVSGSGASNVGPIVCACFGVGRTTICDLISSGAVQSAAELGTALKAGTNCGSCIPELKRLIADTSVRLPQFDVVDV